jgi:hypothetical protein
MDYRQPLAALVHDLLRAHEAAAVGRTITWLEVDML